MTERAREAAFTPTEPYVTPREPTLEEGGSNTLFGLGLFALGALLRRLGQISFTRTRFTQTCS